MKALFRILLIALAVLAVVGCKKEEKKAEEALAPLVVPTTSDSMAWRNFLVEVAKRNMEGVTESPFVYFLPAANGVVDPGEFNRQLDNVQGVVQRTVLPGNMLVFASPDSESMTKLIEQAFVGAPADALKDVRVLFIGTREQGERVKAAIAVTNANFVLYEIQ